MSPFQRRNLEFRVAAPMGRARGAAPRAEPPMARDQGAAPWLSLGLQASRPLPAARRAGNTMRPVIRSEIPLERRGEGREAKTEFVDGRSSTHFALCETAKQGGAPLDRKARRRRCAQACPARAAQRTSRAFANPIHFLGRRHRRDRPHVRGVGGCWGVGFDTLDGTSGWSAARSVAS